MAEVFIYEKTRLDIADYLQVPNEWIKADKQIDNCIWFHVKHAGYSATLTKNGGLKKHSIRIWS